MRLNLTVVADYLADVITLHRHTDRTQEMTLKYPVFYRNETSFQRDLLYIADAKTLSAEPHISAHCSIICLGFPPQSYHSDSCELLCVSPNMNIADLFNKIGKIFDYFYEYEKRIQCAIWEDDPWSELGDVIFDIFCNPVYATDPFDKFLFVKYDPNRSEFLERYQAHASLEYVPEDERSITYMDPAFSQVYTPRRAFYCVDSIPIYGSGGVVYNLFE